MASTPMPDTLAAVRHPSFRTNRPTKGVTAAPPKPWPTDAKDMAKARLRRNHWFRAAEAALS